LLWVFGAAVVNRCRRALVFKGHAGQQALAYRVHDGFQVGAVGGHSIVDLYRLAQVLFHAVIAHINRVSNPHAPVNIRRAAPTHERQQFQFGLHSGEVLLACWQHNGRCRVVHNGAEGAVYVRNDAHTTFGYEFFEQCVGCFAPVHVMVPPFGVMGLWPRCRHG